ncbi:hypothetical protein CC80DRAFT_551966 [Byssothecium circinans]|uniref:Uncharacterized protein n=1 Tax=Byssothecium circinans TaxID=147558 RepID=A0A6A5TQ84_9PLEO|nr:hypothetical protein CC80DRAFT_551966 [Byssothecium circinans]
MNGHGHSDTPTAAELRERIIADLQNYLPDGMRGIWKWTEVEEQHEQQLLVAIRIPAEIREQDGTFPEDQKETLSKAEYGFTTNPAVIGRICLQNMYRFGDRAWKMFEVSRLPGRELNAEQYEEISKALDREDLGGWDADNNVTKNLKHCLFVNDDENFSWHDVFGR